MLGEFQIKKATNRRSNTNEKQTALLHIDPQLDSTTIGDYGVRCSIAIPEQESIVIGAWFKPQQVTVEEIDIIEKDFNLVSDIYFLAEKFKIPVTKTAEIAHSAML
jgi:hypothetical protein